MSGLLFTVKVHGMLYIVGKTEDKSKHLLLDQTKLPQLALLPTSLPRSLGLKCTHSGDRVYAWQGGCGGEVGKTACVSSSSHAQWPACGASWMCVKTTVQYTGWCSGLPWHVCGMGHGLHICAIIAAGVAPIWH